MGARRRLNRHRARGRWRQAAGKWNRLSAHRHPGLVLTGDSRHYSRYTEAGFDYITAGGGGAFLHPTHQLRNKSFAWDYPPPNQAPLPGQRGYRRDFEIAHDAQGTPAMFPSPAISRRLTWETSPLPTSTRCLP